MGPITKVYNEAMRCAEEGYSTDKIQCLRLKLEQDIGDDKDKLLYYKIECSRLADYTPESFLIAIVTLIATVLSFLPNSDIVKLRVIIGVVYVLAVGGVGIMKIGNAEKYKTVLMVLEAIESEMNKN